MTPLLGDSLALHVAALAVVWVMVLYVNLGIVALLLTLLGRVGATAPPRTRLDAARVAIPRNHLAASSRPGKGGRR